jgi:hypothetical protein
MAEEPAGGACRLALAAEIVQATRNYLKTVAGREIEYVMHPATFIGPSLRWKDYLNLGPRRVPSSAGGGAGKTAAEVERERAEAEAGIESEKADPALVSEAEAKARAFKRRAGLPAAEATHGA